MAAKLSPHQAPHIRKCISHPGVSIGQKFNILRAYSLSRGMFSTGVWPRLKDGEARKFGSSLMKSMRTMVPEQALGSLNAGDLLEDGDFLTCFGLPSPGVMLMVERLCLLVRFIKNDNPAITTAILAATGNVVGGSGARPRAWADSVFADLAVVSTIPKFEEFAGGEVVDFARALSVNPGHFTRAFRKIASLGQNIRVDLANGVPKASAIKCPSAGGSVLPLVPLPVPARPRGEVVGLFGESSAQSVAEVLRANNSWNHTELSGMGLEILSDTSCPMPPVRHV